MEEASRKRLREPTTRESQETEPSKKRQRTSFGEVSAVSPTDKKVIENIGQLYKGVIDGTLQLTAKEYKEKKKEVRQISRMAKDAGIQEFRSRGIDKGIFIEQVQSVLDFLEEGPQERVFPENFLQNDPEGVNRVIGWIVVEASFGSAPDEIARKLALSPEEKKAVVFQLKHLQRRNEFASDDIALYSSILGSPLMSNYKSKTDDLLDILLSYSPEEVVKKQRNLTIDDLISIKSELDELGLQHIAQFQSLYTKIDQLRTLSLEIEKAFTSEEGKKQQYTQEQVVQIAASILFEIPGKQEGRIKIDIGDKKLQKVVYDQKTGDVYILHKKKGKEFFGSFKVVKTVTKVNIETLKTAKYVQLLTLKKDAFGNYMPLEQFKLSQEKLKEEMSFLEKYGLKGEFYLEVHKAISYTTTHDGKPVEKVTFMVPQYSGDGFDVIGKCTFPEQALIMRNTIFAVAGFHERHLIHFDVKPENLLILVNDDGIVEKCVLSDYGTSYELSEYLERKIGYPYGSPQFAAPELLLKKHPDFITQGESRDFDTYERLDAFAVGITLYDIAFNRRFWDLQFDYRNNALMTSQNDLMAHAKESRRILDERIRTTKNPAERDFLQVVRGLLAGDPAKRMSVTEAKKRIIELEGIYGKDALYPPTR